MKTANSCSTCARRANFPLVWLGNKPSSLILPCTLSCRRICEIEKRFVLYYAIPAIRSIKYSKFDEVFITYR